MASRRTDILDAFKTHLGQINSVESRNVYKQYRWIDELNDYPAITFGDGAMDEVEQLVRDVETQVETFTAENRNLLVESALVASVRTDEGLMHPYGVGDMDINITYDVEITT